MAKKQNETTDKGHFGQWKSPDGREVFADTIADANQMKFDGWEIKEKPTNQVGLEVLGPFDDDAPPAAE